MIFCTGPFHFYCAFCRAVVVESKVIARNQRSLLSWRHLMKVMKPFVSRLCCWKESLLRLRLLSAVLVKAKQLRSQLELESELESELELELESELESELVLVLVLEWALAQDKRPWHQQCHCR